MNEIKKEDIYKSESKNVGNLAGFSLGTARQNEKISILQRSFLTSFDQKQAKMMEEAVGIFCGHQKGINALLVVIRKETAIIYKNFPLTLLVRMKTNIEQYHVVTKKQILDIEGVIFKDIIFDLDVQDGDKFLWLFREGFNFGLYFDFSGDLKISELSSVLGRNYRNLFYYSTYSYFQESENAKALIEKGWFPFVQIIGDDLERLISGNKDDVDIISESLISNFSKDRIESFTKYWWENTFFNGKKKIIEAGIAAFLNNTDEGNINCIKNLLPEIEGVARLSFYNDYGKNPSMTELKSYLLSNGKQKFATDDSFGFSGLFADYLNEVIFKNFSLENNSIDFSRHSVGHGVASEELYTRARSLQCILTLDQIYFYLGNTTANLQ